MPVMQSPPGARTVIDGRPYVYFAGTGYLGLQGHPEVIRAACEATVRDLAPDRTGLLFGPSHRLMSDVPDENLLELVYFIRELGGRHA